MRLRVRQKPKAKAPAAVDRAVERMDETTWAQWYQGKWEYRRYRRQLRDRDLWSVYWSEVHPRHFQNAITLLPKMTNRAFVEKDFQKNPPQWYVIEKLLN